MNHFITRIVGCLTIVMALFHLYSAGIRIFPATQQRAVHLGLALALIFLIYPFFRKKIVTDGEEQYQVKPYQNIISNIVSCILGGLALFSSVYIYLNFTEIIRALSSPSNITIFVATVIILLTLEASRRIIGWALPSIALLLLLYAFFGEHLPILVAHAGYTVEEVIVKIGISNEGVLGVALGVSSTYIILFVIFGALLERSGAGKLIIDLAMSLVGRYRGGPAKVSVVASALFGSISGNPVSNVMTTGVLTIPLMKKSGLKPEYAGAIETISSTGGMFLPPVMGAVSFLIADFLQIEYSKILIAAIVPAILYFIAVFIMVDLRMAKIQSISWNNDIDIAQSDQDFQVKDFKLLLLSKGHLLLPLVILIYLLLVNQNTLIFSAFWSIISIPVISFVRKETRMSIKDVIIGLQEGVKLSLLVVAACMCAGIVIGVIDMTGIGLRFSSLLIQLSGGNLFILLVFTMITSIILGMGLPPVASYVLLAILAAPAMINLGVSPLAAHLFIFYYGTLSLITPPVGIASFAASGLANSSPTMTGLYAMRLGSVAFIIPFMFIYGPPLLLDGSFINIVFSTITAVVGVFALSVGLEGYFKKRIALISRFFMVASALLLLFVGNVSDVIGILIIGITILYEIRAKEISTAKNISS